MSDLESRISYYFTHKKRLQDVCVHPSAASVHERTLDFERLEFLGDRVLGLVIAEQLYQRFISVPEGVLAHRLTQLVCQSFLAHVARSLQLQHYVRFSGVIQGQEDRVLADACEALIGAVYLDGGLIAAQSFIVRYWGDALGQTVHGPKDPKSQLQEWTQARGLGLPCYHHEESEGDLKVFIVTVSIPSLHLQGEGKGRSKKIAQSQAAESLLRQLNGINFKGSAS